MILQDQASWDAALADGSERTKNMSRVPVLTNVPSPLALARMFWAITYGSGLKSQSDVIHAIQSKAIEVGIPLDGIALDFSAAEAQWCECGFPRLQVSQKRAAMWMATGLPKSLVGEIAVPWPTFDVLLPPGTLWVKNHLGSEESVDRVFLHQVEAEVSTSGEVAYMCSVVGNAGTIISTKACQLGDIVASLDDDGDANAPVPFELGSFDRRALVLAGRLLASVMIDLDSSRWKHRLQVGTAPPRGGKVKRGGRPTAWVFQMCDDVQVDCREWVRAFLEGKTGSSASVQSLVRGHHKRQPCGAGNASRKWILIAPYWRGPESAPIAVRTMVLGDRA